MSQPRNSRSAVKASSPAKAESIAPQLVSLASAAATRRSSSGLRNAPTVSVAATATQIAATSHPNPCGPSRPPSPTTFIVRLP